MKYQYYYQVLKASLVVDLNAKVSFSLIATPGKQPSFVQTVIHLQTHIKGSFVSKTLYMISFVSYHSMICNVHKMFSLSPGRLKIHILC